MKSAGSFADEEWMECAMPKLDIYRSQIGLHRANDNHRDTHHRRLDRIFDNLDLGFDLSERRTTGSQPAELPAPAFDMTVSDDVVEITAEVPGFSMAEIDVTICDAILTITGNATSDVVERHRNVHVLKWGSKTVRRSLALPYSVEAESVDAKLDDGVLRIRLPKAPEPDNEIRRIEIMPAA